MSTQQDDHSLLVNEILESPEAFQVLAMLIKRPRALDELEETGLEPDLIAGLVGIMTDLDILGATRARKPRCAIRWKPFTRLFIDAAVGMDTEISIMVEAYEESEEGSFEDFASRASRRVARFERDLVRSTEFAALIKEYLNLLVGELLVDDPRMYDMTLLDAAVAFESLFAKVGAEAFKKSSKRSPELLALIRGWAHYASGVNLLGEVALAECLDAHGLVRR
ncbi:MAG: hypothetical protein JRG91_09995 [Deltaproteobacteria bacterium]|nr:hypothetical protein [Deltaproteobacteria bacterium]